ncbi:hypothetical protein [Sphingobacterium kyonggiense]
MERNFTNLITLFNRNHGATIALAKLLLKNKQFELFLFEAEIEAQHSMMDFLELNPQDFDDLENCKEIIKNNINQLQIQRDSMIK